MVMKTNLFRLGPKDNYFSITYRKDHGMLEIRRNDFVIESTIPIPVAFTIPVGEEVLE